MLKKLIELESQLQAERRELAAELQALQTELDQPEPAVFDELVAARQLTAAKTADHLDGTQTANAIAKAIDKERGESVKKLAAFAKQKAESGQKCAMKQAQLTAIDSELASIAWKIKGFIQEEAKILLEAKTEAYRAAAVSLLNALVDIDALNAIIADLPNENPAKSVLLLKSLPRIGLETSADVSPWQIQEHGEKLIFTSDSAFPIVNSRFLDLSEEIKGSLYERKPDLER
ncbi:hypothetical protein [Methylomonas koyamae]|uniref:Uncharacterized protein n=1 Tax=Methylomonas koyamae TaxID=702114 RepID=A0A291IFZ2_9GAMM|nr:hypothetical protein [Methylomonas koyamae]ATG89111.1 hypothetical protein MKLM6_0839 [Methylomonas koyamae]OAI29464.1 hypothetical protein A1356_23085 [Methylomonas koyamae]